MSFDQQIEALTGALKRNTRATEALALALIQTGQIDAHQLEDAVPNPAASPVESNTKPQTQTPAESVTGNDWVVPLKDIMDAAKEISAHDGNHDRVNALLNEFGISKIRDIVEKRQTELFDRLLDIRRGQVNQSLAAETPDTQPDSNAVSGQGKVTLEDVLLAAKELAKHDGNNDRVNALLNKCGVTRIKALKSDQFTDFFNAATAATYPATQEPAPETAQGTSVLDKETVRAALMSVPTKHARDLLSSINPEAKKLGDIRPAQYPQLMQGIGHYHNTAP
jgi:hypothetical protein